ncbi:uncharacterized protein LOC111004462 [Pieris rapae]|uniref:uncharacterized protein LOC111004462 n=1 Tax=Pieris rapae TaxID=64459 RepID=UPI001E27B7D3|nr:uncharacterized protein LOC111004462 [Pieris rapae]XP_022131191.2 uncharacterized protein LOC111004462 [Pieris rapae]
MAINSPENQSNDSRNWQVSKKAPLSYNESITSSASSKRQRKNFVSPYLNSDKVKLHSRVTEKTVVQRKTTDFTSSFPLAVNIYKANSDEFKISKRASKKGKKCVHTLLNDPTSQPQICTVSDMNDSEYNETKISRKPKPKVKKRRVNKNNQDKNIEIYDRDAKYCSQFNINLDSSSSDMFQHLTGDGRKVIKKPKNIYGRNQVIDNDVWAVLRNINKMQFIPSPPMSGTSIESLKNMSSRRRTSDRKDASFIETCRTEEFAYISYDNTSLNSPSRSSSFDRVTVIGKQDDVTKTYTYTKRGVRDQQGIREVLGNKKSKKVSKKNCNNKTESNNKKLQQKLIKEDLSLLQENIIKKDENLYTNSEQKLKALCASEVKRNAANMLMKPDPEKSSIASESERQEQLNGITRVVLCNGIELHDSKNDCKQREARKCQSKSTSPNGKRTQITTAEIRKKIASLKYPIIVTGKEKLSSYTQVNDYKPPQFLGLDKHIWPFMIKWLPESQKATISIERKASPEIAQTNKLRTEVDGFQDRVQRNNNASCKLHNNDKLKKYKNQLSSQPISVKEKPMRIFKDKMLNLMYSNKYSILQNAQSYSTNYDAVKVKHDSFNIETQTPSSNIFIKKDKYATPVVDTDLPNINSLKSKSKHSWSKAKWASDFIENVIRKVKCGVYYGQESKKIVRSIFSDSKLTQTDNFLTGVKGDAIVDIDEDIISNQLSYNGVIPGFEDKIQDLKLETVSKSQIAVKHCNTNVVVQFDIAFPIDTNAVLQKKDSILLLPTEINASRIYKYKATITNAILPAELCSIFPKMLSNIFDSNITPLSPQLIIDDIQCHDLFPIKELTLHECLNTFNKVSIFNISNTSLQILLQNGRFANAINNIQIFRPKMLNYLHGHSALSNLLPEIKTKALFENNLHLYKMQFKSEPSKGQKSETAGDVFADNIKINTCTAVVPYVLNQTKILDLSDKKELNPIKTNSYWCVNFDLGLMSSFKVERFGTKTVVSLNNNTMSFTVNNLRVEMIYKYCENVCKADSFFYDSQTDSDGLRDQDTLKSSKRLMIKKNNRRSSYVKLCKKCKSTSSIPHYKRNTPLQKIANLDEFFQALGSAKSLADAIDGDTERKILLSIVEMKAWITEISPRQALMILLLANKKETANIIRFRNVILQGIATNRITKISELDMEIEVIERENLNNSALLQGISYVPASAENQENLLEELCWIAKTTASDYQKPFDKTSERLLKSLLGKRKKLNASYLRVMARYVGLGLLKSK